ncbi:hypothetical protein [Paludisphaera borealis]|uniref:Uncharacterized protein n=1 Tax=Paludisphaera borealis TaxID=1387353 RepID=A0A1U7CMV5_9BACT|nr:hypothetical protein [Paludisphaera borealis]APW60251.1 hypothetical protein BSF38_01718 [Paludisphaera borealis]
MSDRFAKALPRISTIDMIYGPVAGYLEQAPYSDHVECGLSPLDNYVIHLILEFCPRPIIAADLASRSSWGATTIACLANHRVARVAVEEETSALPPRGERLHEIIQSYADSSALAARGALAVVPQTDDRWERLGSTAHHDAIPVLLLPASIAASSSGEIVTSFLDRFADGVVVVLGMGKTRDDPNARGVLGLASSETGPVVHLLREEAPSLYDCSIALVFHQTNRVAPDVLKRIEQLFTTNYDFLTLVRDACLYAVERGVRNQGKSLDARARSSGRMGDRTSLSESLLNPDIEEEVLRERNVRLQEQVEDLEAKLRKELERGLGKTLVVLPARRFLAFGRRYRKVIAPRNSLRERFARGLLQMYKGRKDLDAA